MVKRGDKDGVAIELEGFHCHGYCIGLVMSIGVSRKRAKVEMLASSMTLSVHQAGRQVGIFGWAGFHVKRMGQPTEVMVKVIGLMLGHGKGSQ